jgi:DNA-binding winged helix-turn-helix (wHTH) protein
MRVAFGECILDTDTRTVSRGGRPVHVGPTAYQLLQILMAARPRVLSKLELFQQLWPSTAVSESSLSTVVAELREALGEGPREARYLRTVYGFGYAFVAKVTQIEATEPVEASARLAYRLTREGWKHDLAPGSHVLGRANDAAVCIDAPEVSRHHARITVFAGGATIEDLGSRNGTFRNGEKITAVVRLAAGDRIAIGPVAMNVETLVPGTAETLPGTGADAPRKPDFSMSGDSGADAAIHEPPAVDEDGLSRNVAAGR